MKDIFTILNELQNTPVPILLVGGGILFLFIAVGGQFGARVSTNAKTKYMAAGIIGIILMLMGLGLYVVPIVAVPPLTPTPISSESPSEPIVVAVTATLIPSATITQPVTPTEYETKEPNQPITITDCPLYIGQEVHRLEDARFWTEPDVFTGSFIPAEKGAVVYILAEPKWGKIHLELDVSGWWWEISYSNKGKSLGWVWEGVLDECNR